MVSFDPVADSSRSLSRCTFADISLPARGRTKAGTSRRPIPCPAKSMAMVSFDRRPLSSVSTVTSTEARMGPSMPRTPHVWGGSMCVTAEVTARSANPMCRVVTHRSPIDGDSPVCMCPSTTPLCHSTNRRGSVTYANTSAGGRSTSMLVRIGTVNVRYRRARDSDASRAASLRCRPPPPGHLPSLGHGGPSCGVPVPPWFAEVYPQ